MNSIDLWWIDLVGLRERDAALQTLLSAEEVTRAARFRFDGDRRRFVISHALLRLVLAEYAGGDARELRLDASAAGKPYLAETLPAVEFNLAHSGDWALIAVAGAAVGAAAVAAVGVDIELQRDDVNIASLATDIFTPAEWRDAAGQPESAQREAFFRGWVRKEAVVKAIGSGLRTPLTSFAVGCGPPEPTVRQVALPEEPNRTWHLCDLPAPPNYHAALAYAGAAAPLRFLDAGHHFFPAAALKHAFLAGLAQKTRG